MRCASRKVTFAPRLLINILAVAFAYVHPTVAAGLMCHLVCVA